MEFKTVARKVMKVQAGAFTAMEWERELPVRAAYKGIHKITKRTSAVVRFGVEYDNIGAVQTKRTNGQLPSLNAGLTWGEWSIYPYFIKHKNIDYVRCALSHNNTPKVQYFNNGVPITKEQAEMLCTKAAFSDSSKSDILTIRADNIRRIG